MAPRSDWPAIRRAYEAEPTSMTAIASRFRVCRQTLRERAAREGWVRCPAAGPQPGAAGGAAPASAPPTGGPDGAPDVAALVASLQRTTARLVAAAETRFAAGEEAAGFDEKDLRTLGALAATLAKVIALDTRPRSPRDPDSRDPADGDAVDFDDPRQLDAFSERLERLAAGAPARGAGGADRG